MSDFIEVDITAFRVCDNVIILMSLGNKTNLIFKSRKPKDLCD